MDNTDNSAKLGINFVFFVIYMAGLSAFGSFVNDMYLPSLPSMTKFFGCSVPTVELGLSLGMAGLGLGEFIMGPTSDKYGRKPVLVASLLLFLAAAVISIFSPTIYFFIVCRFFQGAGAAGGYFLARSMPTDVYGRRELAKTMAIIGAINGFAPASAPVIGGLISSHWGWRGVFVALSIFAVILFGFSFKVRETLPKASRVKISLLKTFTLYKDLLVNRKFMVHVLLKGAALGVLFIYISSAPFIMQTHFGFSQVKFGIIMGCNSVAVVVGSMLALRFRPLRNASFTGAIILFTSVVAEAILIWHGKHFLGYELPLIPMLFALGMIFTSANTLAMDEGRAHAGMASAILGIIGYIFGTVAAPISGSGDILHPTALLLVGVSVIVVICAIISHRFPSPSE